MDDRSKSPRQPPWRVVVIAGGTSSEREVSLKSGNAVLQALQSSGHDVARLDPAETPLSSQNWSQVDVAFIALHGSYGEDGVVQSELEQIGVTYTGSGPRASGNAFSKLAAKELFLKDGLPTPEFWPLLRDHLQTASRLLAESGRLPVVIKPDAQGSSLGVTIVEQAEQLPDAIQEALVYGPELLMEQGIPGEEWTVPVLDDRALPAIRITPARPVFDYSAKYVDEETRYDLFAEHEHPVAHAVMDVSRRACAALGCRGLSRVDLRVDPQGRPWLLEVNTVPGLTDHSLAPKSAAAMGWPFPRLCEEMIRSALRARE